jgi:hypothetical protein
MNGAELAGVAIGTVLSGLYPVIFSNLIAGLLMCPLGILFGSLLGTLPDNCCERGKPERVVAAPVPQQEMQPVKNNEQPKIPPPRGLPPQIGKSIVSPQSGNGTVHPLAQKPADYNTQIENVTFTLFLLL